jgi:hypothetical protein
MRRTLTSRGRVGARKVSIVERTAPEPRIRTLPSAFAAVGDNSIMSAETAISREVTAVDLERL